MAEPGYSTKWRLSDDAMVRVELDGVPVEAIEIRVFNDFATFDQVGSVSIGLDAVDRHLAEGDTAELLIADHNWVQTFQVECVGIAAKRNRFNGRPFETRWTHTLKVVAEPQITRR